MKNIFIAGHNGMVGSALVRALSSNDSVNIVTATRAELNLLSQTAVLEFFARFEIDEIYLAAAKVGGIHANDTYPAEFIHENLVITTNVVHAAHENDINKILFLGSSCIYPRESDQPIAESSLLTGPLENTNEPYAIAKIAGIKLCESYNRQYKRDYRSVMPTNLYGPKDYFHPTNSHVIPGLFLRLAQAVQNNHDTMTVWGTGSPMREFLHVDDMAAACLHIMNITQEQYASVASPRCSHINVGTGIDCTIAELTATMKRVTGFNGELVFDTTKPDGTPRKLLDVSRLHATGWQHSISLEEGLSQTWDWFKKNQHLLRS